ncbi:MAG: PAS domain S-box protein, partial [Omnitrophica bacterium]|nr:PAS domain S-box protein [Candidatus Omnitrophota bacterium]
MQIMQETLSRSDMLFRDFFNNAPIGFHIFGPGGIIIDINQTEIDMLGYTYDEIVGKKRWSDLIIPEQKERFEVHWRTINETGEVRNLEYTLVCKNGHHIDVLLNASARFDESGKLINTRGSILDITEHKNAEETLKKQKKALEEKTIALAQVISQIEVEKNKIKENITTNINELIMPNLKKLRLKGASEKYVNLL